MAITTFSSLSWILFALAFMIAIIAHDGAFLIVLGSASLSASIIVILAPGLGRDETGWRR